MTASIIGNIVRFLFVLLLQGLIVNRLDVMDGMILPQVYLFAILLLPVETPRILTLVIAGVAGMIADLFTGTPGLHATACLILGYVMPLFLRVVSPRDGYEFGEKPTVQSLGLAWYLSFATPMVLIHHFALFFLEVFRFDDFFITLGRVVLSTLGTVVLLVIGQYLIFTQKAERR